jgi:ATP-dependent exoDNAse (exonuclease V) beta subunit
LVSLLVQSWGEGAGLAATGPLPPTIFIVGDRKQSIYGFRDADVSILREAARHIGRLRPGGDVRRSISRSFRAVPPLLAFVNDICQDMDKTVGDGAFEYEESDRFPIEPNATDPRVDSLGVVLGNDSDECAAVTAREIARFLHAGMEVRDRDTGLLRPVRPGDIAVLFRSRESHREFEAALAHLHVPSHVYKGLGFFDADEVKDALALIQYLADPASDLRAAALMRSRMFGLSDGALRQLAPHLAGALLSDAIPSAFASLDATDAAALTEARASTARWRGLVDRIGPAELVDSILTESAYGFELRGNRLKQARENLKKLRALLRRLQNRGHATLTRVADHLDRVAVGDESNAAVDALDAVNLMTVHASKGLEFPIVFVVNLARGIANRRNPVRWSSDGYDDTASVAVGEFQPETDERLTAREREETKRLVYVALTRARDRLYLASTLKDGQIAPSRGSLAEVMPTSLLQQLSAGGSDRREWRASSHTVHRFRVCSNTVLDENAVVAGSKETFALAPVTSDFAPLLDTSPSPQTVASLLESGDTLTFSRISRTKSREWHRLTGTLVHQLLHRFGAFLDPAEIDTNAVMPLVLAYDLARTSTEGSAADLATDAVAAYRSICARPEIRDLFSDCERLHEVPFTMRIDGRIVRGTIDCLIRTAPDRITVLEFKTGRRCDEDHVQLGLYRRAAERLFPGTAVDARLVYAAEVA